MTTIVVSPNDVKAFERLRIISQIAPIKERLRFFENKYGSDFPAFEKIILRADTHEDFDQWDDYIEWKGYFETLKDLQLKLEKVEDVKDIRVA